MRGITRSDDVYYGRVLLVGVARRGDGDFMVVEKVVEAFEVLPTFPFDRFPTP